MRALVFFFLARTSFMAYATRSAFVFFFHRARAAARALALRSSGVIFAARFFPSATACGSFPFPTGRAYTGAPARCQPWGRDVSARRPSKSLILHADSGTSIRPTEPLTCYRSYVMVEAR